VRGRARRPWEDNGQRTWRELEDALALSSSAGDEDVEVRRMQPARARKAYVCPGCQQQVLPGTGHLVVVPRRSPEMRRHWHNPCWEMRERRRPGR
jgi:hypothetical protein